MNAYISSSTSFNTYTYGDPNFDCWIGTPQYQFYPNDSGFTRSDVLYGFRLSNFLNFDSSSATFSYSFDIPAFNFAAVNKPTKFGFFICNSYTLNKIQSLYFYDAAYKQGSFFDCAELYYVNPDAAAAEDPRLRVYAFNFVPYSTGGFTISGDCVTDNYASDLVCVLGSFSDGKLRNYSYLPTTIDIQPYGDTLQQCKDNVYHSDVVGSDTPGNESGLKGILAKIKALPSLIADKLKSLFVPSDSDVNTFKQNMSNLLSEHLGGVYQAGSFLNSFLQKLKDFSPYQYDNCADYDFRLPPFVFFVNPDDSDSGSIFSDSDNGGSRFDFVPVGSDGYYHVDFSFLDNKPYKQIYTVYKAFVTVVFLLLALNFCKRKFDDILGGVVS